jgi:hypothetical protein
MKEYTKVHSISDFIKAIVLTTIIISILGYLDFITGEISLDILYIFCICTVTWYTNLIIGMLSVAEIIFAKTTADYYDNVKIGSHLYEWNTFSYLLIYIIVCVLVGSLKRILFK